MYYYILEQPRGRTRPLSGERLTDLCTDYGIAGEMVTVSPLKTIDELLEIGCKKGYTTMVAVGSDGHIHRVIASLMHRQQADRPVLGVIPLETRSLVGQMIGAADLRAALQTLKYRRLAYATLLEVLPAKFIFTQAHLAARRPVSFMLSVDQAEVEVLGTELILTGDGHVQIFNTAEEPTTLARGFAWLFGATIANRIPSLLHGERIRIGASEPVSLVLEGETIAKTPVAAQLVRRALKIVVARATVGTNQ